MADKDKNEGGMDQMFEIWEQGQSAFFKAQSEAMDTFKKTFGDMPDFSNGMNSDQSFPSWDSFIKSWVPDWDPNVFADKSGDMVDQFTKSDLATPQHEAAETWRETLDYTQAATDMGKVMQDAWDGKPIEDLVIAQQAWMLAWQQMLKTGERMIRSNDFLGKVKDDDVAIAETSSDVVFEIDKVRLLRYKPLT
ncbi:hypothetical protein GQR58_004196 [Nymphon striatum]|nr:hypothetical protein GQR58_004196 [Nymphon striatum]